MVRSVLEYDFGNRVLATGYGSAAWRLLEMNDRYINLLDAWQQLQPFPDLTILFIGVSFHDDSRSQSCPRSHGNARMILQCGQRSRAWRLEPSERDD